MSYLNIISLIAIYDFYLASFDALHKLKIFVSKIFESGNFLRLSNVDDLKSFKALDILKALAVVVNF